MGLKAPLESWEEPSGKSNGKPALNGAAQVNPSYHSPLTAMNSSNPFFADFQPHNANMFSIHDDMPYTPVGSSTRKIETATASYFVFGYYAAEKYDPFTVDRDMVKPNMRLPFHREILKACFMKLAGDPPMELTTEQRENLQKERDDWLNEPSSQTRLVCHGMVHNVEWRRNGVSAEVPAEDFAKDIEARQPIAVGTDVMDALGAYLTVESSAPVSDLLHNIATLVETDDNDPAKRRQAAAILLQDRYAPYKGESHWHFAVESGGVNNVGAQPKSSESQQIVYHSILPIKPSRDFVL